MTQGRTAGALISLRIEKGKKTDGGQIMFSQLLVNVGNIVAIEETDKGRCVLHMIDGTELRPVNWISEIEFLIDTRTAFSVGRYDYRTEADELQAYRESVLGWKPRDPDDMTSTPAITKPGDPRDTDPTDLERVGAPSTCIDCGDPFEDGTIGGWTGGEGPLCNDDMFARLAKDSTPAPETRNELMMLQSVVDMNPSLTTDQMITKLEEYAKDKQILNLMVHYDNLANLPTDLPFA